MILPQFLAPSTKQVSIFRMVAVSVATGKEAGMNVRNVLNRKRAWLKYYEWENMVVWNLSLCVRFEQMLATIFSDKK